MWLHLLVTEVCDIMLLIACALCICIISCHFATFNYSLHVCMSAEFMVFCNGTGEYCVDTVTAGMCCISITHQMLQECHTAWRMMYDACCCEVEGEEYVTWYSVSLNPMLAAVQFEWGVSSWATLWQSLFCLSLPLIGILVTVYTPFRIF
jgi:hypothetical protein